MKTFKVIVKVHGLTDNANSMSFNDCLLSVYIICALVLMEI